MATRGNEQLGRPFGWGFHINPSKPWQRWKDHNDGSKYIKKSKARYERRKAKVDPECIPTYAYYFGYYW